MSGPVKDEFASPLPSPDATAAPLSAVQHSEREGAHAAPDFRLLFESLPGLALILLPDAPRFTVAAVSDAYLAATLTQRSIVGRGLFEVFPDNPDDPAADGVRNLSASLNRVLASRCADTMALQKYDVERPDGSGFEEKWWSPVNTPLLVNGEVRYIIHLVSDVTAEVILKRESARQASLLTTLVEAMPSGVLVSDLAGKILVNNPAAQAITRLPTQDIPADSADWPRCFGMHTPEGRLLALDEVPLGRALRGEMVKQQELLIRNDRNGEGVHVTAAARPLHDAQGAQIGALVVFTDISERVDSERALAESEARYKELSDNSPVMIIRYLNAPGWPMLFASKAALEITGYAPQDFTERGLLYGSLVLKDDIAALSAAIERQLAVGRVIRVEYRILRKDGSMRWIEGFARLVTFSDGREGFEGTNTDITARKDAERLSAERANALERATIAIQAARIAPFSWYVERDFVETNALGETLHGLTAEDTDRSIAGFMVRVHPEDQEALAVGLRQMIEQRHTEFSFEYRTLSQQGRVRWVRNVGSLSTDDGVLHTTGAVLDATIEVEVQRALEERTREMERANTELDEFTYIASHDLKEPLRGIHNYARFIAEDYADKLDAGGQHMLKAVSEQAERMQRLIEDLLEIARLGREPMKQSETDLDKLVDEVLASLSFSLAEKKVEVRKQPLGHIVCDRVRVGEVFRNLITNALKYNDKQVPVIDIGCRESGTGETEFYVQDNGIGIKPDFHARVFAPFKRLHAKDAYGGGSGVGLAIVKRIVEAHGGYIGIRSEPGAGATFAFTLKGENLS